MHIHDVIGQWDRINCPRCGEPIPSHSVNASQGRVIGKEFVININLWCPIEVDDLDMISIPISD